jgi:hypothetical protein
MAKWQIICRKNKQMLKFPAIEEEQIYIGESI